MSLSHSLSSFVLAFLASSLVLGIQVSQAKDAPTTAQKAAEAKTPLPKNFELKDLHIQRFETESTKSVYELHNGKELSGNWLKDLEEKKTDKSLFAVKDKILKDEIIKSLHDSIEKLRGIPVKAEKCDAKSKAMKEFLSVNFRDIDGKLKMLTFSPISNPCSDADFHIANSDFESIYSLLKGELPKPADSAFKKL